MGTRQFILDNKPSLSVLFVITLLLIVLQSMSETVTPLLRYENNLAQTHQWWRLFSAHFIHLNWAHLLLNLAALWILVLFYFDDGKRFTLITSILLLSVGTSAGLYIFSPNVSWYVGLSGVLHGLFIIGATIKYRTKPYLLTVFITAIIIKLLWEQFFSDPQSMQHIIGNAIVFDGHLYGAITGFVIAVIFIFRLRKNYV